MQVCLLCSTGQNQSKTHQWARTPGKSETSRSPALSRKRQNGRLISCIQGFVIESQNKRIIVDTCVGNDKPRRGNPAWDMLKGSFLEELAAAGFPRESIDVVLCTHLHIDHVGWNAMLVDGNWLPAFSPTRATSLAAPSGHTGARKPLTRSPVMSMSQWPRAYSTHRK